MIIVKLFAGMGNQMFQYAAARQVAYQHNTPLKLDITSYEKDTFRNFDLSIFNIKEVIASSEEINRLTSIPTEPVKNILYRLSNRFKPKQLRPKIVVEKVFHYNYELEECTKNTYIYGHWQSEKYFKDIKQIIREEFSFRRKFDENTKKMAEMISSLNSICLNVRRSDYVTDKFTNQLMGVCNMEYYRNAIDMMVKKVQNPFFFIFSDDLEWCRENITLPFPFIIVGHEYASRKFEYYLQLMSLCKHQIIPNSTFAWWGAWLNKNPEKIVIAPNQWFAEDAVWYNGEKPNTQDIIPEGWMRI